MYTWSPYPFLRITAAFILGVLLYKFVSYNYDLLTLSIVLSAVCFLYFLLKKLFNSSNAIIGNFGLIIIGLVGFTNTFLFDKTNDQSHIIHSSEKITGYAAVINSAAIEKERYFVYEIDLESVVASDSVVECSGIVKLYVRRVQADIASLSYGDRIFVKGSPFRIAPPGNPNEFNYMAYMAGQNIYFQQFANIPDIKVTQHSPKNPFMAWAINWRAYFSKKIDFYVQGKDEAAIAKALILGVKDGLDNKIKASYASAGAMHVLAVSGLHAGIIHMILQFIFRPFIKKNPWKFILPIVSVLFLWGFAMITGLSPSIMRATTMFIIIIIGQYYFDRPNIFNSLALSALILLSYNPNFLFSVGFQLSYLAVAGIVYLFPIIYHLIDSKYWLIDKLWSISAVSIAAQIATFPISIYYFHQFPVYFLLSNLVVIPAAFLVMSLGILLLSSNLFFLSDIVGFTLETLIRGLNVFVSQVENMHLSLIDWLYINEIQTFAIYGIILSLLMLRHYRKMMFMKLTFCCVLIISFSGIYDIIHQFQMRQLVFYKIKGHSLIDSVSGLRTNLLTTGKPENVHLIKQKIEPNRLSNNLFPVAESSTSTLFNSRHFSGLKTLVWQSKRILFITEDLKKVKRKNTLKCDIVVISNNAIKNLKKLNAFVDLDQVIIDSSNDNFTTKKLIGQCESLGIAYNVVAKGGAIILEN